MGDSWVIPSVTSLTDRSVPVFSKDRNRSWSDTVSDSDTQSDTITFFRMKRPNLSKPKTPKPRFQN